MKRFRLGLIALVSLVPVSTHAQKAYITNSVDNTVSVIETTTNTVIGSPIHVGFLPYGLAVTPDGSKVYAANDGARDNSVSVIDTATNTVSATIPVGLAPTGVSVTPDGGKVYAPTS